MSRRCWNSGPPPHVGWWETSLDELKGIWRWWNGKYWGLAVGDFYSLEAVKLAASLRSPVSGSIKWTTYYPKNARVERRAP